MDKDNIVFLSFLGIIPAIGAATTLALDKVVTKYGHSFMQIGPKSALLIGTIGAVQNLAAMTFSIIILVTSKNIETHEWMAFFIGSTIAAGILVGVTALAARVNLISARLSLFAAAALIIKSYAENVMTLYVADELGLF